MNRQVVVLGGGFAGVSAIKKLLTYKNISITLIDKNQYHLFTPSLYEVATSETPQKNIAIPFPEIFGNRIAYHYATVEKIDTKRRTITTSKGTVSFDYLLIALGSKSAYHHISGLEKYSLALKSLDEAVAIKNKIKNMCCKEGECNKKVRVIIGGGGFSGTELAAELLSYKDRLAKQHHLAKDCLDITIIQGSKRLLPELDLHVSAIANKRLTSPMVHFAFGGHIIKVTEKEILTDDKKTYPYDILLWTGGIEANNIVQKSDIPTDQHGQIIVNDFLQVMNGIFAAGDIAGFIDPITKKPVPQVAEVAQDQGEISAANILRSINNQTPLPYTFKHLGYIVPLKGRFAAAELMGIFHVDGFFGWVLQQFVFLNYLFSILPFWKAVKRWNSFEIHLHQ